MFKLLILGHGTHGKDAVAEILRDKYNLSFKSSSQACADIFIFDSLKDVLGYSNAEECFNDRHNHRNLWYELIKAYNHEDRSRLASEILSICDVYVGMRDDKEYKASKHLFDHIIWVDAHKRVKYVDPTLKIRHNYNTMHYLDNNGSLEDLENNIAKIVSKILE